MLDVIPEARQNLIIYLLKIEDIDGAFDLTKNIQPIKPQDYVIIAIVNTILGQELQSIEHIKIAQQYFQIVGSSESECNTLLGVQCKFSSLFLLKQFDDALLYLDSIKNNHYDEILNFNYAQIKAVLGLYKEAQNLFLLIQSDKIKSDYTYMSWLTRCYIMNKQADLAWEFYLKLETCAESFSLLQLIANDCYLTCQFYYAAKAFDILDQLDSNSEYCNGKQGACVGVLQLFLDKKESKEHMHEIIQILQNSNNEESEHLTKMVKKLANKK